MYDLRKSPEKGDFPFWYNSSMNNEITVRKDIELGTWQGLGGAITEATAYNYAKLSPEKKHRLLEAYYGERGLAYRWARLSIGSNDFCLKPYRYTQKTDLSDFSIVHDEKWVIPMARDVLGKKAVKFVASPWSPPDFMKLGLKSRNYSFLKPWCFDDFAKYMKMWLSAYKNRGVDVSFVTIQNEPRAKQVWESCIYSFLAQKKLAYKYLAKELKNDDVQILLWDHNKETLSSVADRLFQGRYVTAFGKSEKIAGLCFHWYDGTFPDEMWRVRQKYPDILMMSSEMSCGFSPYDEVAWKNDAKLYCRELLNDINAGASVWIDWNMLLSWRGGPSYCKNYLKSPIILNEAGNDFILTPIYRALKRFAELFPVGSKVIRLNYDTNDIVAVGRKVESSYEVVVVNVSDGKQEISVKLGDKTENRVLNELDMVKVKV